MPNDDTPRHESDGSSRRRVLKGIGAIAGSATLLPSVAGAASSQPSDPREQFRVEGEQVITAEIEPETVTITKRKRSPDLRERYGLSPPVLVKERSFDRPDPARDPYPRRDTRTIERDWNTYYAKEDEWQPALAEHGEVKTYSAQSGTIGTQARQPGEEEVPYGVWDYEQINGGYEVSAPMNVISQRPIPDVTDELTDAGWTTVVIQYNRYAWNSTADAFQQQERSAATGTFGFLGRKHIKMWSFGGYTSASAHIDSAVPHTATSYDDAEAAVEGIFDRAQGWNGADDYYNLGNGGLLDHDGKATGLFT